MSREFDSKYFIYDQSKLLVAVQQGSALLDRGLLGDSASESSSNTEDKEKARNDKGKDPLQGKRLGENLVQAQAEHQGTRTQANAPVIEHSNEESGHKQEQPHEDIGNDSSDKLVHVEQNSTVPENGKHQPGPRQCHSGPVDQSPSRQGFDSVGLVDKVQVVDVSKVGQEHELGPEEVGLDEKQGPHENTQVEGREVPSDLFGDGASRGGQCTGGLDRGHENLHHKGNLQEEQHKPVDQGHENVCRERSIGNMVRVV